MISSTVIKTQFHFNHSSTTYAPQSLPPPAPLPLYFPPTRFSSPSPLFFSLHAETKPVTHCVGCKWDVFDVTSETWDQILNTKPEFRFTQQKRNVRERLGYRERTRENPWVLICIELLCLSVKSFLYITSRKIWHLQHSKTQYKQQMPLSVVIRRSSYCTPWSNKVQNHKRSNKDLDSSESI